MPKAKLSAKIREMGGTVSDGIKGSTTICISNKDEVSKGNNCSKMAKLKMFDIPVVGEGFLKDAAKGDAMSKIPAHTISPWGKDPSKKEKDDLDKQFAKGTAWIHIHTYIHTYVSTYMHTEYIHACMQYRCFTRLCSCDNVATTSQQSSYVFNK